TILEQIQGRPHVKTGINIAIGCNAGERPAIGVGHHAGCPVVKVYPVIDQILRLWMMHHDLDKFTNIGALIVVMKFVYELRRAISAYKKRQNCDPSRRIREDIECFPTEPYIIQYVLITKFYEGKFNTKLNRHFGTHILTRHDIENYI